MQKISNETMTACYKVKLMLSVVAASAIVSLLAACGSQDTNSEQMAETKLNTGISVSTKTSEFGKPASEEVVKATSAKLGSYFNGQNANNPKALIGAKAAEKTMGKGVSITEMVAASNVEKAVFRFYNTITGAHFFTMSEQERDYVQSTFPFFTFEGKSFLAYPDADASLSPVYRFYNKVTGTHFFTISPEEKAYVQATWPTIFNYEGISWNASIAEGAGWVPVYRFFNTKTGAHFYTTSAAERDHILVTWNWFTFEGIAYYVKPVPETVACTADPIATTGYSLVFKGCDANNVATYYDKTECVRDNTTGLIWEGKSTSGLRRNTRFFNNFDDTTKLQGYTQSSTGSPATNDLIIIFTPSTPSQLQIDSYFDVPSDSTSFGWGIKSGNSIGYAKAVSASSLCGFTDWRRPAASELMSLVKAGSTPTIDTEWFPNTVADKYWTGSGANGSGASNESKALAVNFFSGNSALYSRQTSAEGYAGERVYLRLVR